MGVKAARFICLYCLCCLYSHGQDTIFRISQDPLLVRVLEISDKEVRYKNFYNPDDVVRVISNMEITRIIYENGKEEPRFKSAASTVPGVSGALKPNLFVIEGKHIVYKNEDITHKMAFKIMMQRDFKSNSYELNDMLVTVQRNKTGQVAFAVLTPACILGGILVARHNLYGPNDYAKARATIFTGFALGAGSFVTAMIYKGIKNKHIRRVASIYNNEI
jgi:hypothetical protein